MKLSEAQKRYIKDERQKMAQREKDLDTFGDDIYKSKELSSERVRIYYRRWFFNMMIDLHNVEVEAEKASFEELKKNVDEEFRDGHVK